MALAKISLFDLSRKLQFDYKAKQVTGWGGALYWECKPTNNIYINNGDTRYPDGWMPVSYMGLYKTEWDCYLQLSFLLSKTVVRTGPITSPKLWFGALYTVFP